MASFWFGFTGNKSTFHPVIIRGAFGQGHRLILAFERYNIVNDVDSKMVAQKQEAYLNTQKVTKTLTTGKFGRKKEAISNG